MYLKLSICDYKCLIISQFFDYLLLEYYNKEILILELAHSKKETTKI